MQDKKPLIIGLGLTGKSLVNFLSKSHDELFVVSESVKPHEIEDIERLGVKVHQNPTIDEVLINKVSVIYPSPGVPYDHEIMKFARQRGVPISSDIELFLRLHKSKKILVTGTNGKTSSCLMIYSLFQYFYPNKRIKVLGNIGTPVLSHLNEEIDIAIVEISSFQLELLNKTEFDIGVLLNIEEDHLDRHGTKERYTQIKKKVLEYSSFNISFNNENLFNKDFINFNKVKINPKTVTFPELKFWPKHDIKNLKASISCLSFFSEHFTDTLIQVPKIIKKLEKALINFSKPEHRFENIGIVNGINYINDSKATNLHSMQNAIHSVSEIKKDGDLFLICGGDLKGQNLSLMDGEIMKSVSKVFIFGKDKHLIASQMKSYVPCTCIEDLDEAVLEVSKIAKKDDFVLLSPACSSTDMFKNYEERGDRFKKLVSFGNA